MSQVRHGSLSFARYIDITDWVAVQQAGERFVDYDPYEGEIECF